MINHPSKKVHYLAGGYSIRAGRSVGKRHPGTPPPSRKRNRRLRCDCGQPAVTVLSVRVGSNPQYTVRLWLCADCLALEQGFKHEK